MRDDVPLIFWLLAGYFRVDTEKFKTKGIFRVTNTDVKCRELDIHLSQENFGFLREVTDPNLVANHWKRILRNMMIPIIPFDWYDEFFSVGSLPKEYRV